MIESHERLQFIVQQPTEFVVQVDPSDVWSMSINITGPRITRRDFFKIGGTALVGIILSSCLPFPESPHDSEYDWILGTSSAFFIGKDVIAGDGCNQVFPGTKGCAVDAFLPVSFDEKGVKKINDIRKGLREGLRPKFNPFFPIDPTDIYIVLGRVNDLAEDFNPDKERVSDNPPSEVDKNKESIVARAKGLLNELDKLYPNANKIFLLATPTLQNIPEFNGRQDTFNREMRTYCESRSNMLPVDANSIIQKYGDFAYIDKIHFTTQVYREIMTFAKAKRNEKFGRR